MKPISFRQFTLKWQLFLILGMTGILLVLGSYYYYHTEELRIKKEKHSMLKAVADLKAEDIRKFIKERNADLMMFAESQFVIDNIEPYLKNNNEEAKEKLIQRMSLAQKYYDYENVFITSPSGTIFLSLDTISKLDPLTLSFCKKVNDLKMAEYNELYFCPTHKSIHFDLISPVINKQNVIEALIILRIDPDKYLFPLVQSWPTPSKSSEVLLVRKDGNDVLFLNELKFQKNTALQLRYPLTRNDIPAAQAVLGLSGVFEGKDYRGVDVLSDLRPIPGIPWFMISKIDQAEVYSELNYRVVIVFLFATIILILLGTGMAWLYSTRQKNTFIQLYQTESALRQTQEEFKITLYSIGDAVITTNIDSLILMMNPVAEQLTGWKEQEAKGKPLDEVFNIIHEESHEKVQSPVKKVIELGVVVGLANHTLLISKDGTERPIADSGAPIRNHDKEIIGVVLVFRDQTKERAAQKSLEESNLLIQNIVENLKASEKHFRSIIENSEAGYFFIEKDGIIRDVNNAWIKLYRYNSADEILGRHFADIQKIDDLDQAREFVEGIMLNDSRYMKGEFSRLCKDGTIGFHTFSARPVSESGQIVGIEGFILDTTERRKSIEQLSISEAKFRAVAELSPMAIYSSTGSDQKAVYINEAFYKIFGFTIEDVPTVGVWWIKAFPDEKYRQWVMETWQKNIDDANINNTDVEALECLCTCKDGSERTIAWVGKTIGDEFWAFGYDYTERKHAEDVLKKEQALSNAIIESIPGTFYMLDETGQYVRWNAYQRDEIVGKPDDLVGTTNALDTIHPDDRGLIQSKIANVLANGVDETVESRVLLRGGPAARWLVMTGRRMLIEGHPFLVGIGIDITERKQAEEEIGKQLAELRRWYEITLDREGRVLELKQEVNELLKQRGEASRYESAIPADPDVE